VEEDMGEVDGAEEQDSMEEWDSAEEQDSVKGVPDGS